MLSGVKFIPQDQLKTKGVSKRKKDKHEKSVGKKERTRKKKSSRAGSSDEEVDNRKSLRRKDKKWYSLEENSPSSLSRSGCNSNSDEEEGTHGEINKKNDTMECGNSRLETNEISRREMGLDWMLTSGMAEDKKYALSIDDSNRHFQDFQTKEMEKSNLKELNPYLKDNGTGYPDNASDIGNNQLPPSSVVGDGGASWRLKALKRAKEQAAREGRKLDEIVEERWGSLGHLAASVASHKAAHSRAHLHAIKDRKRELVEGSESVANDHLKGEIRVSHNEGKGHSYDASHYLHDMKKPKRESFSWRKRKDHYQVEDALLISSAVSDINKYENDGSFMHEIKRQSKDNDVCNESHLSIEELSRNEAGSSSSKVHISDEQPSMSNQECSLNQLAAKAFQLRLKGQYEEAERLQKQVEAMNNIKKSAAEMDTPSAKDDQNRYIDRKVSRKMKERVDDGDRYLAQTIMKNKQYDLSKRADDEYDFDNGIPLRKNNRKKEGITENKNRISHRILTQEHRCRFCFENPSRPKHLVVSIAQFTYMMLPPWQSVMQGHCCILPLQHESATRSVDDNVWDEIRNFKKCLIMMFAKEEKDVIFLETVVGLAKQQRHCLVECLPLPRELAKEAPLYFKKAIDEAEDEWSQHNAKKLISITREKGLRRSIPKDFPYFCVEFGLDEGFVHVIDDEGKFNSSLGLNVIRGMLQMPEEDMYRRRRIEPIERQQLTVSTFAGEWRPFDWTRQLHDDS